MDESKLKDTNLNLDDNQPESPVSKILENPLIIYLSTILIILVLILMIKLVLKIFEQLKLNIPHVIFRRSNYSDSDVLLIEL